MIFHAQSLTEEVMKVLDILAIRGYSKWVDMVGRGSFTGEPHHGSHTWPALNSGIMIVLEDERVAPLFARLKELDSRTEMQGLRAYSWTIDECL